jgi:hypothetical protein
VTTGSALFFIFIAENPLALLPNKAYVVINIVNH